MRLRLAAEILRDIGNERVRLFDTAIDFSRKFLGMKE